MLPPGIGVSHLRLFLIIVFVFLPSLTNAQGGDSLRTYEGDPVTIEENRQHEAVIKGATIRTESVASIRSTNGANRIGDIAVKLSPSISNRKYGSLGGISLLSFRGLPPEYTVIYRDGIRLTNEQNSLTDLARVSASSVERIELLPSTSSILLGGDAIGAAINLISPVAMRDLVRIGSSSLSYEGLEPGELEHSIELGAKLNEEWGISLTGTRQHSSGDYPFWHEVSRKEVLRENNDAQLHDIMLRVQRVHEDVPLTFTASHVRARRGAPGPITVRDRGASAFVARQNDEDLMLGLQSSLKIGEWILLPSLSYQSQYEEYKDAPKLLDEHYDNKLYAAQIRSNGQLTEEVELYAGASLQASTLESNEISTAQMPLAKRNKLSAYLASAVQLYQPLLITGALRVEHISDRGTLELLPQLSAIYELTKRVDVMASYGLSYHAPTLNQLHWKTLGNPNLRSEHAENGELGVAYHESLMGMFDMRVEANLFSIRSHDQILWLATESNLQKPVNVQDSRSRGLEFAASLRASLSPDLSFALSGGYTLLDAENITPGSPYEGKRLPFSAQRQFVINGLVTSGDWGSLGASCSYRGLKYSDLGNTDDRRLFQVTIFDASYTAPDIKFI
ncbi:MAG TPA: TonB-dependent receptor, partial [Candidatus Kapabacteria bacterium]|nr:TonB-dependent receptor [Candidatus Kapabacteria bacterium]